LSWPVAGERRFQRRHPEASVAVGDRITPPLTVWTDTDERVLRWVASLPFSYAETGQFTLRDDEPLLPSPELEGLDWKQLGRFGSPEPYSCRP
jgi:hypothetical protein